MTEIKDPTQASRMGVLRVLTTDDPKIAQVHGRVIEQHLPRVTTDSRCIPDHPDGIPSAAAESEAEPYIIELANEMADDVDVVLISCALDPAVNQLQSELSILVVGAGKSVASIATTLGKKTGTLSIEGGVSPVIEAALGDQYIANERVEGADTTNYLTTDEGRDAIRNAVSRLEASGCEVVVPSCTGLTTAGVIPELNATSSVAILDPVIAMGMVGYTVIQ